MQGLIPDIKQAALSAEPILELTPAAMETNVDEPASDSEPEEEKSDVVQIRRTVVQVCLNYSKITLCVMVRKTAADKNKIINTNVSNPPL